MTPEEEIIYLEGVKEYANSRIKQLKQKVYNDKRPKPQGHKLAYTGLFVQADCLIPYVQKALNSGDTVSAIAERAIVSTTTISNILIRKHQWMREETAESILLAMDLPHIFNKIEKVRINRKYVETASSPESHFYEE